MILRGRRGGRLAFLAVLALALCVPGCDRTSEGAAAESLLVDVTERVKLDFVHTNGPWLTFFMPEIMGPGVALLDFDNDDDLDIYLLNGAASSGIEPEGEPPRNRLFRHEPDHTFLDVTEGSGLGDTGNGMGVAVGDYDNDGYVDVFVTNYGPNVLLRNTGDGSFEDVTDFAGVGDDRWGTSATFLDYDADGWLDLYVANYMTVDPETRCFHKTGREDYCHVGRFPAQSDLLYRNNGDGTFSDVSEASGIGATAYFGLGVVGADLSGDGRLDIYVANDQTPNQLWVNHGDGTFRDEAVMMGIAYNDAGTAESSMGIVCADLDGDADLDLALTHLVGETHTIYRNEGDGYFADATTTMGAFAPSVRFTGFGIGALDLEHDGDLDLAIVNGHPFRGEPEPGASLGSFWNDYAQPGQLLRNEGQGRFIDISEQAGRFGSDPQVGRGLAVGDLDHDGDLDLVVTNCNAQARVFYNEAPKAGHWLSVRAWDELHKRDAIGAVVTLIVAQRRRVQMVNPGYSYLSSSEVRAHFGLGEIDRVDAIEVLWPDGVRERFPGGEVDRRITLSRGRAGEGRP